MNHATSIQTKAPERYLLGELLPDERDAFEKHYFECPECAGDIYSGQVLAESAHAVFHDEPAPFAPRSRPPAWTRWGSWFHFPASVPMAAALALLTITVYQNAVLYPGLRRAAAVASMPGILPSAVLVPSARSAMPSISIPTSAPFLQLSLALPPATTAGRYDCELRDGFGHVLWTVPVSLDHSTDDINLLVPSGQLENGAYEVILRGGVGPAFDPFQFQLVRQ